MTHQNPFTGLRSILAQLYPQVDAARRISQDAGLELSRISFHGAAIDIWNNILSEAQYTNHLDDLMNVIRDEYGENRKLNNAYINFLQWSQQGNVNDIDSLPIQPTRKNNYSLLGGIVVIVILLGIGVSRYLIGFFGPITSTPTNYPPVPTSTSTPTPNLELSIPTDTVMPLAVETSTPTDLFVPPTPKTIFFDDFESGEFIDGERGFWDDYDPINATIVDGGYQSGKAVQISYVDNTSYSINMYPKLALEGVAPTRLADGKVYEVTAWCKAEENEECTIQFGDLVHNAQNQPDYFVVDKKPGTNDWIPLSVCLQQNNQRDLNVHIYAQLEGSQVLYDDVRIVEVESCP